MIKKKSMDFFGRLLLLVFYYIFNIVDLILTTMFIDSRFFMEVNPVARYLYNTFGVSGLIGIKLIAILVPSALFIYLETKKKYRDCVMWFSAFNGIILLLMAIWMLILAQLLQAYIVYAPSF